MLVQEARLAMRFDDDNIAATFELGNHDGTYYFLMEYVDGVDLGTVAMSCENRGARLSPPMVAYACMGIARGLAHAHELADEQGRALGVVHRDVSPQNVLVSRHGEVKIIDFGVAKVAARIQQTMAGIIKGKYAYMSPEQASAETVDARSDIFSLGVCLWEMLAGKPLFRGLGAASPFAVLRAVREEPIAKIHNLAPGLSPELSAIVHRALERDRGQRYQSMRELADALHGWLQVHAPGYGNARLAEDIRQTLAAAPAGSVPQNAIATPPIAKMRGEEFQPSQLSVVAVSPLERPSRPAPRRAPLTPPAALASGRGSSLNLPRLPVQGGDGAAPTVRPPAQPAWWPSRRLVLQLLWVGIVALVFALGWSTIATLVRMGVL
jgi:serine/threonine protein kinase